MSIRLKHLAVIALLLSAQPLLSQTVRRIDPCYDPCPSFCNLCGDWEVGAHALYWTPISCAFSFAVDNTPPAAGRGQVSRVSSLECSGDWGFRVFGTYEGACTFVGLSYQWFESKTVGSRSGNDLRVPGVPNAVAGLSRVDAHQRLDYQNVDLRWGRYLHRVCGCSFFLFGNVKWIDLSARQTISQVNVVNNIVGRGTNTRKAGLQGGAVGIGVGTELDLWCNFGVFGNANVLGVVADQSTKDVHSTRTLDGATTIGSRTTYPSETCVNPEFDFRVGVNYRKKCGCVTLVGEVGYEIDYFWNALRLPSVAIDSPQNSATGWLLACQDLGFSGLFFGGRLVY